MAQCSIQWPVWVALTALVAACSVDVPADPAAYAYFDRAARRAADCKAAGAPACDDGNPCTSDDCDPLKGCQFTATPAACDDGDACTTGDACKGKVCVGQAKDCNDANACTSDACAAASGCVATPVAGACDDGDACTIGDSCSDGQCGGQALACDDGQPCTDDACDGAAATAKQACTHAPNQASCDDGDACTQADVCASAVCAGKPLQCDNPANCKTGETCSAGVCQGGSPKVCNDNSPCTEDSCVEGSGCVHKAVPGPCDDGDACTTGETCKDGACKSPSAGCDDANSCTTDSCSGGTGCTHVAIPDGAACDDGDPCTLEGKCANGKCAATGLKCTTDKPCFSAFCASKTGACTVKPSAEGSLCGAGEGVCSAGNCLAASTNGGSWGLVPAGAFWMGCNASLDSACGNDEKPQHEVTIQKPYWMGVDEVTVAQYAACVSAGKCKAASTYDVHCNAGKPDRDKHPINCVPWGEAQAYCQWLGGALPTEAQWEMAARGRCSENGGAAGCKAAMRVYPWGNQAPACGSLGVYTAAGTGCGKTSTWEVGVGSPLGNGPYGMRDMAGNVWEWVADWSAAYSGTAVAHDLGGIGPATGEAHAARGGGFSSPANELRASSRGAGGPVASIYFVGFRCTKPGPQ